MKYQSVCKLREFMPPTHTKCPVGGHCTINVQSHAYVSPDSTAVSTGCVRAWVEFLNYLTAH